MAVAANRRNILSMAIRGALISAALGVSPTGTAQPMFTAKTINDTADNARSVFAADVDGDGDTDVLSASSNDDRIAWYENDGAANFTLRTIATNADFARSIFAVDVNGDGHTDVLTASSLDDKIAWYENDGAANFTLRTIVTNADSANSIFAADVDGDGHTDVLSASSIDGKIAWYENDGATNFTLRTIVTNAFAATSVFATDVDGDGDTDVLSASGSNDRIAWYENDGTANFTLRTIVTNADNARAVFATDVDGDGDTDVLSASAFDDKIAWYENDGAANFTLRTIVTNADTALAVFATDVDDDGDTDVLSASQNDDKVAWYENDGAQNFSLRTIVTNANGAQAVFATDVDGDGDTDVLSASLYDNKIAWYKNSRRQTRVSIEQRTIVTNANDVFSVIAADVDNDGDTDVLSASRYDDKIAWYENDGAANFTLRTIATNADFARSVFAADVDGDGDTDVLSASQFDDKVAWYENDGDQNFTLHTIVTNADAAVSVFAADVDGDGDTDALSASSLDDKIAWYENDGAANFTLHTIVTNANTASAVFAADVDGDGDTDVLSASALDFKIAWYENDGAANFTLHTIAQSSNRPYSVFATDVDRDGDTDVLSASAFDDEITWYENDGVSNFTPRTIATNADGAKFVFAADLDGDGDIDVLSASGLDDKIAWYENDGAANFTLRTITTDADYAISVVAADLDGDGDTDVLSGSRLDDKISWYVNNTIHRTGAFDSTHEISTSALGAESTFAVDLDKDGDKDVLSASKSDDKIAWYENDGSENFELRTIVTDADGASSIVAADVDNDGDIDVLSTSLYDDKVAWYENDGNQGFSLKTITTLADLARAVFAIDLDKDGDIDALSASGDFSTGKIAWYENDGAAMFSLHTISTSAKSAFSVFAADVDDDGDVDVLSASRSDNKVAWYENDGSQSFTLRTITIGSESANAVRAIDLDDDGDLDLLSAFGTGFDDLVAWHENNGAESFTLHTIAIVDFPFSVLAVDLDGDGDNDILTASANDDLIAWHENDGAQNFTLRSISTSLSFPRTVFATDLDGDGDMDVIAAVPGDHTIAWYENCGGQFFFSGNAPAAAGVFDGDTIELLELDFLHNGRAGDSNAQLDSIALKFTDNSGNPLNSAQANNAIEQLRVYFDDGDDTFDSGSDLLLATVDDLLLTPRALTRGVLTIPLTPGAVAIAPAGSAKIFVVADIAIGASRQSPFRVALNEIPLPRPQASDASSDSVLSLECAMNAQSAVIDPIPLVDLSVGAMSGTEADMTAITVTATASGAVTGNQTVDVAVTGTGITVGDFTLTDDDGGQSGTQVLIPDGMTSGSITFTVQDDSLLEAEETATLTISNPSAGIGLGTTTTQDITITDNDAASLSIDDATGDEGTGLPPSLMFTVTLTGDVQDPFSVPITFADITAIKGTDYEDVNIDLNFSGANGEAAQFEVPLIADAVVELTETFTANIGSPTNAGVTISDGSGTGTITNDDVADLTIADINPNEGDAGTTNFVFTVTLNAEVDTGISIDYATADGTATLADGDYSGASGTLNFAGTAGEQETLTVNVTGDTKVEANETFSVNLSNLQAAGREVSVSDASATGTITNDDGATVSINDVIVAENAALATFTVTLSEAVQGGFSVDYATADDSALAGSDFTATSGTLNFTGTANETQTFTVDFLDDSILEGDEQFFVNLSNVQGSTDVTIADGQGIGTIDEDDTASIAIADVAVAEGDSGTTVLTFTTTLTGEVADSFTVDYSLAADTATAGTDYTNTTGTLSFTGINAETQTFNVDVVGDALVELDEAFFANLASPSNTLVTVSDGTATGTISNDDSASLSINDVTNNEGDIGTTSFNFTVTLDSAVDINLTVDFAAADGTATTGEGDYQVTAGTLNFAGSAGEVRSVTVPVTGDVQVEADETFSVELSNLQAGSRDVSFSDGSGLGTITNDDASEIGLTRDGSPIVDAGIDDLGFVPLGTSTVTYTIGNTGNATGTVDPPTFANPVNVQNVTLAVPPAGSIPAGDSTTFDVAFETLAIGPFSFDLSFANNDTNEDPYNIIVQGDVPAAILSSELPPPILLVDNDSDGNPNPSDTARFQVLLRNDGEPAAGELRFDFSAPDGTTVQRANRSGDVQGDPILVTEDKKNIIATFRDVEGGGIQTSDLVTFELLIDNEIASDVLSLQGRFTYGADTFLTDDPNVAGPENPTLVPVGLLSRLLAEDPNGLFGTAAAITQGFMAVASPGANGGAGSVRIYRILVDGTRQFVKEITVPEGFAGTQYGTSVAVDADILVVGSNDDPTAAKGTLGNKVAIYRLNSNGETLIAQIAGNLGSGFGASVAIDGEAIIVGAPEEDVGGSAASGAIYRYSLSNLVAGTPAPQRIAPATPQDNARFGAAIASENDTIVIGAPGPKDQNFSGTAYLYSNILKNLKDDPPQESTAQFGAAVAIEGNRVFVGAPRSPGGGGVFEYDAAGTRISNRIAGSDTTDGQEFGASLAIDQGQLYVGAPGALAEGVDGEDSYGAVYSFTTTAGKQLTQMEKIGAFSESSGIFQQQEAFGAAVAVENGALVIGAPESQNLKGAAAFRKGNPVPPPDVIFMDSFEEQ